VRFYLVIGVDIEWTFVRCQGEATDTENNPLNPASGGISNLGLSLRGKGAFIWINRFLIHGSG
jgi:hypothetical protein